MTATWLREGRLSRGFTQKELSEASNISVRSIQRIENGDLIPRSYTLKALAAILGLSYEEFMISARKHNVPIPEQDDVEAIHGPNKAQQIILSLGICLVILFMSFAFVVQSADFPETTFEGAVFLALVLSAITASLYFIWRTRK